MATLRKLGCACLLIVAVSCITGCCAKGTLTIAQPPRFLPPPDCVTTTPAPPGAPPTGVPVPDPRPGYPKSYATGTANDIQSKYGDKAALFEVLYRYDKLEAAKPNDRIFQFVEDRGEYAPNCHDPEAVLPTAHVVEYFNPSANDMIQVISACESIRNQTTSGWVAIVDLNDLPADIRSEVLNHPVPATENTQFLHVEIGGSTPPTPLPLTDAQAARLVKAIKDCAKITWTNVYEYDGCHPTAPHTSCHAAHCLTVDYSDSNKSDHKVFPSH